MRTEHRKVLRFFVMVLFITHLITQLLFLENRLKYKKHQIVL